MNILPSLLLLTGLQSSLAQACRVLPETYGEWGSFQSYNGFVLEEEHSIGNFKLFSAADCAILCFTENRDTCRSLSYNRWTSHCIIYDGTPLVSSMVELHGYHLLYVDTTELTKNSASIPRLPVLDDSCGSNPCQNGGTCITDCNTDNFICHCGIDWTGTYCDVANVVDTAYSCGDTATDLSGTVESPNYPGPYPTDLDCEITIRCSAGQSLWLNFDHFSVGDDLGSCSVTDCLLITVYTGGAFQARYKFFGSNGPPVPFDLSYEEVKISFTTTSTFNPGKLGFHASYEIR